MFSVLHSCSASYTLVLRPTSCSPSYTLVLRPTLLFSVLHSCSPSFTLVLCPSLLFSVLYYSSSSLTLVLRPLLLFSVLHSCSPAYTLVLRPTLLFSVQHSCSLSYTLVLRPSLLFSVLHSSSPSVTLVLCPFLLFSIPCFCSPSFTLFLRLKGSRIGSKRKLSRSPSELQPEQEHIILDLEHKKITNLTIALLKIHMCTYVYLYASPMYSMYIVYVLPLPSSVGFAVDPDSRSGFRDFYPLVQESL